MARLPGRLPMKLACSFEVRLPLHGGPLGGQRGRNGRLVIRLDGAAGFGLGDHPTTQGATSFLEQKLHEKNARPLRILDWGCGSGVLALCAALSGARAVGVDIAPEAVESARESASLNFAVEAPEIGEHVEFRTCPTDYALAVGFAKSLSNELGPFDIVVANIPPPALLSLAPVLAAAVRPGGELALTGIRSSPEGQSTGSSDAAAVHAAYGNDFDGFREVQLQDGWILIEGLRRLAAS